MHIDAIARTVDETTVRRAATTLTQQLMDLEMNLVDLRLTGAGGGPRRSGKVCINWYTVSHRHDGR